MRFLLDFVSCCGYVPPRSPVPMTSSSLSQYKEERRSLVCPPPPPPSSRHRRRLKRGRTTAAGVWKPKLGPICEDDVVPQRCDSIESEREGKRRSDASHALHCRDKHKIHKYDFRQAAASNIVPAFSPMPYMF